MHKHVADHAGPGLVELTNGIHITAEDSFINSKGLNTTKSITPKVKGDTLTIKAQITRDKPRKILEEQQEIWPDENEQSVEIPYATAKASTLNPYSFYTQLIKAQSPQPSLEDTFTKQVTMDN